MLSELTGTAWRQRGHRLDLAGLSYEQLHQALQIGDYLVLRHRYNHIMIYMGTLRDYGYAPEELPLALRPYADHPLFLQSGVNHYQGAWYSRYIGDKGYHNVHTTDGGVCVAVWGVPLEAAPFCERPQQAACHFFRLDGTAIMVPDMAEYRVAGTTATLSA